MSRVVHGLVPRIHIFDRAGLNTWMTGSTPAVTEKPRILRCATSEIHTRGEFGSLPKCGRRLLKPSAEAHGGQALRQARPVIGLNRQPAERRITERRLEPRGRDFAEKSLQWFALVHADDRVVIAAHAYVCHKAGPAGENVVVCGRRMGVCAHDRARPSVAKMAHRLFLARRFSMDVNDDCVGFAFEGAGSELAIDGRKGVV